MSKVPLHQLHHSQIWDYDILSVLDSVIKVGTRTPPPHRLTPTTPIPLPPPLKWDFVILLLRNKGWNKDTPHRTQEQKLELRPPQ